MKKLIISIIGGLIIAGSWAVPVAAVDVDPSTTAAGSAETTSIEGEDAKSESIEVDPTFSVDLDDNERQVKLKFGHNFLLTGNNLSSSLENKSGMLFAAGNNLSLGIESEYGFVAGNTINFSGETTRDLYIAGNAITLNDKAKIGRDVFVAGNTLNVETDIAGDLAVTAASVVLKDVKIAGNLNIDAAKIEFTGKVEIVGTLTYNDNATVIGQDQAKYGKLDVYHVEEMDPAAVMAARVYEVIMSGASLFLAIALICALYPKMHDRVEQEMNVNRLGINLAIGLGLLIGVPAVALFLLCSFIAAPLAFVLVALYVIAIYLSQAFTGVWLGHFIIEKLCHARGNVFVEALIGIVILNALSLIPYVGVLTGFLSLLLGLGLIVSLLKPSKPAKTAKATKTKAKIKA